MATFLKEQMAAHSEPDGRPSRSSHNPHSYTRPWQASLEENPAKLKISVRLSAPPPLHLPDSLQSPKRIVFINQDGLFHLALREILQSAAPRFILERHPSSDEVMATIKHAPPAAVIVEISPSRPTIDCIVSLTSQAPDCPILVVTSRMCVEQIVLALQAGARGYVITPQRPEVLMDILARTLNRQSALCPQAQNLLADYVRCHAKPRDWVRNVTSRERRIVEFVLIGLRNKEISERLDISLRTVQAHLEHVFRKLSVSNREDLRRECLRLT